MSVGVFLDGSWTAPSQVECGNMVAFCDGDGTWTSLKTARDFGDIFHAMLSIIVLLCSVSMDSAGHQSPRPSIYDPCPILIFLHSDHFSGTAGDRIRSGVLYI